MTVRVDYRDRVVRIQTGWLELGGTSFPSAGLVRFAFGAAGVFYKNSLGNDMRIFEPDGTDELIVGSNTALSTMLLRAHLGYDFSINSNTVFSFTPARGFWANTTAEPGSNAAAGFLFYAKSGAPYFFPQGQSKVGLLGVSVTTPTTLPSNLPAKLMQVDFGGTVYDVPLYSSTTPPRLGPVSVGLTAQNATIGDTPILTAPAAAVYRVGVIALCTTASANAVTLDVAIKWTDPSNTLQTRPSVVSLLLNAAGNWAQDVFMIHTDGTNNVTYGTTVTGTIALGKYLLDVTIERVG